MAAFASPQAERAWIVADAQAHAVDPYAALSVAAHEGITLPAQVGDNGTSFGPWQLHAGGALPDVVWAHGAAYARTWADSPAGLDYAIQGLARVAGGLRGHAAIVQIVGGPGWGFERPANPSAEVAAADRTYGNLTANGNPAGLQTGPVGSTNTAQPVLFGIPNPLGPIEGAAGSVGSAITGSLGDVGHAIAAPFEKLYSLMQTVWTFVTSANTWIRIGFFVGGLVIVIVGLATALGVGGKV